MQERLVEEPDVLERARQLVSQLERGNEDEAGRLLGELTRLQESQVFREMGQLTRQLHDALMGFHVDLRLADLTEQDIPEAKERLNYVVAMTEQAANQTLSLVEDSLPLSEELQRRAGELAARWERFTRRQMQPEEFRSLSQELPVFFDTVVADSDRLHRNLSDVLMAQGFQDLTGQVLKRVIGLVQEVEENLVNLIRVSTRGLPRDPSGRADRRAAELEGPQTNPAGRADVVSNQDEVDDLLSSLGF